MLWIGGASCAGKSSVARQIGEEFGLAVYSCDDRFDAHVALAREGAHPRLREIARMTWDEVWMRPVPALLQSQVDAYGEEFSMIRGDLAELAPDRRIIAEGNALLPAHLSQARVPRTRAIWLIPSEEFQRQTYAGRSWTRTILARCADPERAFANWMDRDVSFARWVGDEAAIAGYATRTIDGHVPIKQVCDAVARHFGLV